MRDLFPGLTEAEMAKIKGVKEATPDPSILYRYPVQKRGGEWPGLYGFEPHSFLLLLGRIESDFARIKSQMAYPFATSRSMFMPRRWFLSVVLPLALLPVTVALADFSGPVISVLNGDTIEVLHNSRAERIRHNSVAYPFTVFHAEAL